MSDKKISRYLRLEKQITDLIKKNKDFDARSELYRGVVLARYSLGERRETKGKAVWGMADLYIGQPFSDEVGTYEGIL